MAAYEASGGQEANTLRDRGLPIVIVTMHGNKSGKLRKIGLMRVEHDGDYALVASKGGAPEHPVWYYNLLADPHVMVQDGPTPVDMTVHEVSGEERDDLVGALGRGLPGLRRLPAQDRPAHPGLRRDAGPLSRRLRSAPRPAAATMSRVSSR